MSRLFAWVVSSKVCYRYGLEEIFQGFLSPIWWGGGAEGRCGPYHTKMLWIYLSAKCSEKLQEIWVTWELLPPSLIVTPQAKMSYWLLCCNNSRKDVSFLLPFKDAHSSYSQTKPFHNTKSFHGYSYRWKCPFSTLLWEFYWCTKNTLCKKVLHREPNFMDAWQKWVRVATKRQVSYPECWFHIPGENLFLLFLKFPQLWNQLLKFKSKFP